MGNSVKRIKIGFQLELQPDRNTYHQWNYQIRLTLPAPPPVTYKPHPGLQPTNINPAAYNPIFLCHFVL